MTNNEMRLTLFTLGMFTLAAMFVPGSHSAAQGVSATTIDLSAQQQQEKKKKVAPQRAAPQRAAPQRAVPQRAAPQRAAPQRAAPQRAARQRAAPQRAVPQRAAPQRAAPQRAAPQRAAPQRAAPQRAAPQRAAPKAARTFTPSGPNARAVNTSRLRGLPARGAGRASIRGQNYSVWRSGYRVRHGGGWRTFVALSALTAILIETNEFYPYAYISAPEPYCDGLTEDGCQLVWQDVETLEGDVISQCVAYCPWQ